MNKVNLFEVGPRDGLQNLLSPISLEQKCKFIEKLVESGLRDIEAGAFVSPIAVPQMADSKELLPIIINQYPEINFHSLVPNLSGLETAINCGVKHIGLLTSCSEQFSLRNLHTDIKGSLSRIAQILSRSEDLQFKRIYLSMSFHSPWEGFISESTFEEHVKALADFDFNQIVLSDTTGDACDSQIKKRIRISNKYFPIDKIALHCHDTRHRALGNIKAALEYGVRTVDASAGGLGGCPYSPGSSGNVATELVIKLLEELGYNSDVDDVKIQEAGKLIKNLPVGLSS